MDKTSLFQIHPLSTGDPEREAVRRKQKAVKTYLRLTSGRGFSGLSPTQIAKELAARRELFNANPPLITKPKPIIFRPSGILYRYPESAGNFFDALDSLYTLPIKIAKGEIMDKTSENSQDWVQLTGNSSQGSKLLNSPEIRFQPKQGLPGIEIQMSPVDNTSGMRIIPDGLSSHPAPIYVKDVQPWKQSPEIQNHEIKGWTGTTHENQELFSQSKTLRDFISKLDNNLGITDSTSVVHLNTVLPIDPQNKFTAEFAPKIWHPKLFEGETNDHRKTSYKFTVIEGDRASALTPLMERQSGRTIYRTVPDEEDPSKTKNYNWKPNYVPDMGALQKQLINDSKSRIIIIATPYELEQKQISPFLNYDFGGSSPSKPMMFGGASIGNVRVSEGSRDRAGNIIDRELKTSQKEPVIFVIDFLGLRPNDTARLKQSLQ